MSWIIVQGPHQLKTHLYQQLFFDLLQKDDAIELYDNNLFGWKGILSRRKVQTVIGNTVNFFLLDKYRLGKFLKENADQLGFINLIFLNSTFSEVRYPFRLLKMIKTKWPNIRLILVFLDTAQSGVATYAKHLCDKKIFDLVYTFEKRDAQSFGWIYWPTPYSKIFKERETKIEQDLFFCGYVGGREQEINEVLRGASKHHVNVKMNLVVPEGSTEYSKWSSIVTPFFGGYKESYEEALEKTLKANCILEIMKKNQNGYTLRPYEAITYGRKLLTNNPDILNFPYYNPRFIQYFRTAEEIDWEWVKERTEVEYGYKGEYSPIALAEDIECRLSI